MNEYLRGATIVRYILGSVSKRLRDNQLGLRLVYERQLTDIFDFPLD